MINKVFLSLFFILALGACSLADLDPLQVLKDPAKITPTGTPAIANTTPAPASLAATETTAPTVCTVTAARSLHVRSGPGLSFGVIDYLYAGDIATIQDQRGEWYEIITKSGAGFINSHYCEVTG